MPEPSSRITRMPRSGIREIMDLAALRPDTLHLEVGQPDFATPQHIIDAACHAAATGYTGYTANRGLLEVRETIADKLLRENGIRTSPDNIVITCGAVNALFESLAALVSPGGAVLLPDPGWPNYTMMADTLGARVVRYPLVPDEGYRPDLDRLVELARAEQPHVLVINSPSNPTGAVFPRSVMQHLVEIAGEHNMYVISDECYEHIVFDGEHVSPASLDGGDRVVSVFSMSKSYAMTGWRIGYVCGPPGAVDQIAKVQEPVVSCATTIAQKAAQAALNGDQRCVHEMISTYRQRRDMVVELLAAAEMLIKRPEGAFYILADISATGSDSNAFSRQLITERDVAVAPGLTFGPSGGGLVRLSLATDSQQLHSGVTRMINAVRGESRTSRETLGGAAAW
jgi:aspartate/methionine/tyrosine aminotransferase